MKFDNYKETTDKFLAPVKEINKLAIEQAEKLASLQLTSLKTYSDMSIARWKAALEVSDVDSLKGYLAEQNEAAKALGEQVVADAKAVAELGSVYTTEAQKIAKDGFSSLGVKAA